MENVTFENVQELLYSGKKPKEVFEYVGKFNDGFALVKLNGKWNFIDKNGNYLSPNLWFDDCWSFYKGFGQVNLNGKWNYIDKNCNYLSPNKWFDYVGNFKEGFAFVKLNDKWNFIDKNGKILSPNLWFDECLGFNKGFARVELNGKLNYIDKNGNLYDKNKKLLEQKEDKEMIENKKKIYIVLSGKQYIDCFDNPYDAMMCVVKKQNIGEIDVVEKIF